LYRLKKAVKKFLALLYMPKNQLRRIVIVVTLVMDVVKIGATNPVSGYKP
jgi:hypothetical protein